MIPDDEVDRIRESADIVQIIGEHVKLKRVGTGYRGPCPFHQGTKPNFSVNPKTGFYKCFVCNEAGSVFTFVQKRLGLDFPSAIRMVAEKSGLEVREVQSRREGPDPREPFWELNATVSEYFRNMLWDSEEGAPAREYLASRHVSREVADRFGLGYAPRPIGLMRNHLNTLGFDDARLLEGGLLVQRDDGSEPRPRFRDRLIFPILDVSGHTVGFGGRLIGPGDVKYLNSAESPVFNKGKLLYGLNWAKTAIRREERAIIVEGYFDVVRLVAAGIEEVVAPLGTALTEAQALLLQRYTKNVYLLYDSDAAGQKATFRAGDALLAQGIAVQVITLPEGEDPDTFVQSRGADALRAQLADAADVFERKVQLLERAGWFGDLRKKRRAIDRLLPTIGATSDPLTRDLYVNRLSEVAGITRDLILRELAAAPRRTEFAPRPAPEPPVEGPTQSDAERAESERRAIADRRATGAGIGAERELVRVMLQRRQLIESLAERLSPKSFRDPVYRAIYSALLECGPDATAEELAAKLDARAVTEMQTLLEESPESMINPQRSIDDSLAHLRMRKLKQKSRRIQRELEIASGDDKTRLLMEKREIAKEIQALGGRGFRWFAS